MNRKNHLWLIIGTGIAITLVVAVLALRVVFNCCALPPLPAEYTASAIVALNKTIEVQFHQTETAAASVLEGMVLTITPTPSLTNSFPYDATLYAQRRQEEMMLQTGAGPTQYAIFFATEAAIIATYQGTVLPTFTPPITPLPYDATLYAQRRQEEDMLRTGGGPTQYAIYYATEAALIATYQGTVLPTFTPASVSPTPMLPPTPPPYDATLYAQRRQEEERIKTNTGPIYTAEYFYATETALVATYQGTASPTFTPSRTLTPTPTLCPYSDVICPGGNETLSPAQEVLMLMASASAPEFGQLAQTATALYVTLTPSPTVASKASNTPCAFMWAHQDLPEIAAAVQVAFSEAKLDNISVIRADAYGESCGSNFGAMTTDFYLSAALDNFNNTDAIGEVIRDTYNVLMELNVELPARHGYLDIEFTADGETKRFRTLFSQIEAAVESEADGAALIKFGGGLR